MNAVSPSRPQVFKWLLKREFWENRGGFLWAPLLTGGVVLLMSMLLAAVGGGLSRRSGGEHGLVISGNVDLSELSELGDGMLATGAVLTGVVLAFVVFFYALGALYDDRRDRSVLFWKSLPISDAQMVWSKAAWALLLAPLVATVIGIVVGLLLWLVTIAGVAFSGMADAASLFAQSHPLRVVGAVAAALPVYVLWALPTVGWLLFCSAWSRSKPFLVAVLLPILVCLLISMSAIVPGLSLPLDKIWYAVAYRGLLSTFPGAWHVRVDSGGSTADAPVELARAIDLSGSWQALTSADLWIGVAIGLALIAASIPLRRWREACD